VLPSGARVDRITLANAAGVSVDVMTYGATVLSVKVPSKATGPEEVTLNYADLEAFRAKSSYYGSTIGRVGNRIAGGKFAVGDKVRRAFLGGCGSDVPWRRAADYTRWRSRAWPCALRSAGARAGSNRGRGGARWRRCVHSCSLGAAPEAAHRRVSVSRTHHPPARSAVAAAVVPTGDQQRLQRPARRRRWLGQG